MLSFLQLAGIIFVFKTLAVTSYLVWFLSVPGAPPQNISLEVVNSRVRQQSLLLYYLVCAYSAHHTAKYMLASIKEWMEQLVSGIWLYKLFNQTKIH